MDKRAHECGGPERGAVLLAELDEHRPFDTVPVEPLLDSFRLVGADDGRNREGDGRARANSEDKPATSEPPAHGRGSPDDNPEDREGSVKRPDHEVPSDGRPEVRDLVELPPPLPQLSKTHLTRSRSGKRGLPAPRPPSPHQGPRPSGRCPARNRAALLPCRRGRSSPRRGSRRNPRAPWSPV